MLPYRKITTAELEQCLDDPGSVARSAPPSRRRILRDAVRSFHRHLPQLRVRLGALLGIRSVESPLDQAWRNLRLLYGDMESISNRGLPEEVNGLSYRFFVRGESAPGLKCSPLTPARIRYTVASPMPS